MERRFAEKDGVMTRRWKAIKKLRKQRPRSWFVRFSMLMMIVFAWVQGQFSVGEILSYRRLDNLARFVNDAQPDSWGSGCSRISVIWRWTRNLVIDRGFDATVTTAAIAVASIVLAGAVAMALAMSASRTIASPDAFAISSMTSKRIERWLWASLVAMTRAVLILARSIPEYIWAFLFLAIWGPTAWPAVLALAVHNAGVLGKLGAEAVENMEPAMPSVLRAMGSTRLQVVAVGVFPQVLPRFLLYFFYRWETCVREATVLGLLGFSSLGFWIHDARVRDHYDDMIMFIILSAFLVLIGDAVSAIARHAVRHAG